MKQLLLLLFMLNSIQQLVAQNVGIGTTEPLNKLQVNGNLLINTPTTATSTAPTVAQTKTIVNASTQSFSNADSTGRIYDPGGPSGNYNANHIGNVDINFGTGTVGIEIIIETMQLGIGDSLIIKETSASANYLLAVGNGYTSTGKWVFNSSYIYMIFKSNADANVGSGFSLLFHRLYDKSALLTDVAGLTGKGLLFDTKTGSLRAGRIDNSVRGNYSTALGSGAIATGFAATAMGSGTTASGEYATAMGIGSKASSLYTTAMGNYTIASGLSSTAMGEGSIASGQLSTAMGGNTTASGENSTAIGANTDAVGNYSTAMGFTTSANGSYSTTMGFTTTANGSYSTAMGSNTEATGNYSTAMGNLTNATGYGSTSMGSGTTASGQYATAMGIGSNASSLYTTAMGNYTVASGLSSTAMGEQTIASGQLSTAMGNSTTASGDNSTAMGGNAVASGSYSTAMGRNTISRGYTGTVIGMYNNPVLFTAQTSVTSNTPLFIIGNGDFGNLSNSMMVRKDGNVGIGTDLPSANLHIKHASGGGLILENASDNNKWRIYSASGDNNLTFYNNAGSEVADIDDVTGTFNAISDIRLKKNIESMQPVLPLLMKLNPSYYQFNWQQPNEQRQIGLLAQQAHQLFPELVSYSKEKDLYKMNYAGFSTVAIKAIQEQQVIIEKQQKQIDELKVLVNVLMKKK